MTFVMFAKHLQEWPLERAAAAVKTLGFDGLDLTVRPGGFVLPEQVTAALPQAMRVISDAGLTVPMLTTAVTSADDPATEPLLAAAAAAGVPELKLGYHTYREFGQYRAAVEQAKRDVEALAPLLARHGVRGNLHIHSDRFVTANPAVVHWLLEGTDPHHLGAYIDPGHMVIEGGKDVWRQGLELLAERTNLMAVKSMTWLPDGNGRLRDRMVPLEQGLVDWTLVFRLLAQIGFDGTVSLHSEYQGGHSWRDLTVDQVVEQTAADFAYLKGCLARADEPR